MTRILIADDHRLFRTGLRQLCEVSGGFQVVAEADSGREAVALAWDHQPDVILMDIRMPGMDGVEACRQILAGQPHTPIIMLTMYRQDRHLTDALAAGARGYLLKNCDEATLFAAIRAAVRGESPVDPACWARCSNDCRPARGRSRSRRANGPCSCGWPRAMTTSRLPTCSTSRRAPLPTVYGPCMTSWA